MSRKFQTSTPSSDRSSVYQYTANGLIYWTRSMEGLKTLILNYVDSLFPLTYCAYNQIKHGGEIAAEQPFRPCFVRVLACPLTSLWSVAHSNMEIADRVFSWAIVSESWENRLEKITFCASKGLVVLLLLTVTTFSSAGGAVIIGLSASKSDWARYYLHRITYESATYISDQCMAAIYSVIRHSSSSRSDCGR